jgi:polysaccharide deacetylase family protein (PEP-CTERM system associated)
MRHILTIDVEDWYHLLVDEFDRWDSYTPRVEESTRRILEILGERSVRATWFVLGYVAERFPGLVREIHREGHEVATHGYSHQFLHRQTPEVFRQELLRSADAIAQATGARVEGHRASSFTVDERTAWALDILEAEGFAYDSSISPVKTSFYGWPDAPRFPYRVPGKNLVEFPASTASFLGRRVPVAGGFSLRLFPYAFTRRAIRGFERAGHPAIVYVHPWELDPDQPRLRLSPTWRFLRYHGISSMERNLRRLLADFSFGPMGEFVSIYRDGGTPAGGRRTDAGEGRNT